MASSKLSWIGRNRVARAVYKVLRMPVWGQALVAVILAPGILVAVLVAVIEMIGGAVFSFIFCSACLVLLALIPYGWLVPAWTLLFFLALWSWEAMQEYEHELQRELACADQIAHAQKRAPLRLIR